MFVKNIKRGCSLIFILILLVGCAQEEQAKPDYKVEITTQPVSEQESSESYIKVIPINPSISILSPLDEEVVEGSDVSINVAVSNFNIVALSNKSKEDGYVHVLLDDIEQNGSKTAFTFSNVAEGEHSITVELRYSNNSALNPRVAQTIEVNVKTKPVGSLKEFTIEADDSGFYPSNMIKVDKGDKVKIIFVVRSINVYYNGLEFRSSYFKTPSIKPGDVATVEFIADESFKFASYTPSGVKKASGEVIVS